MSIIKMRIILLKDVKGVGRRFDEKNVADGYAINKLLPQKLAVAANGPGAAQARELKKQAELHKTQDLEKLKAGLAQIAGKKITLKMKANEQGHLFASLNAEKLSRELMGQGIHLSPEHLMLQAPIKQTGTFEVPVWAAQGVETRFTLEVLPD